MSKLYSEMEMCETKELECFTCGKKVGTDPTSNKMPDGWIAKKGLILGKGFSNRRTRCLCSNCK